MHIQTCSVAWQGQSGNSLQDRRRQAHHAFLLNASVCTRVIAQIQHRHCRSGLVDGMVEWPESPWAYASCVILSCTSAANIPSLYAVSGTLTLSISAIKQGFGRAPGKGGPAATGSSGGGEPRMKARGGGDGAPGGAAIGGAASGGLAPCQSVSQLVDCTLLRPPRGFGQVSHSHHQRQHPASNANTHRETVRRAHLR